MAVEVSAPPLLFQALSLPTDDAFLISFPPLGGGKKQCVLSSVLVWVGGCVSGFDRRDVNTSKPIVPVEMKEVATGTFFNRGDVVGVPYCPSWYSVGFSYLGLTSR